MKLGDSSENNRNCVLHSTIAHSIEENYDSRTALIFYGGEDSLNYVNISHNNIKHVTAFQLSPSHNGYVNYSTIADNYARSVTIISFYGQNANYEINHCNILRNSQNYLSEKDAIIRILSYTVISESCILENDDAPQHYLFNVFYGSLTICNCTIEQNQLQNIIITNKASLYTNEWKPIPVSFIHALKFTKNQYCDAKYDIAGSLTPNVDVDDITNQIEHKTSSRCYKTIHCRKSDNIHLYTAILLINNK